MKEINGKKYSEKELRAIYKFFTDCYGQESLPNYTRLRDVGFEEHSKECVDLADMYKKIGEYNKIMEETHGKAYELAIMYRDFKRCLPLYLDDDGKKVYTPNGLKLKELEECSDQEIVKSIQKLYDRYIEVKNNFFKESLKSLLFEG